MTKADGDWASCTINLCENVLTVFQWPATHGGMGKVSALVGNGRMEVAAWGRQTSLLSSLPIELENTWVWAKQPK
jgi:hypothetical protein